ncbi:MAG: hypothetical protein R3F62_27425, partial [Planctomycetota bacterium]
VRRWGFWAGIALWLAALLLAWERVVPLEQAIGDAIERRRPLAAVPGDTWLILIDDPEREATTLLELAAADEARALVILDAEVGRAVAAAEAPRGAPAPTFASRVVRDPTLARPPRIELMVPERAQDHALVHLRPDSDGTWRRVRASTVVDGQDTPTLFAAVEGHGGQLVPLPPAAVTGLPLWRMQPGEAVERPWKGGRWVVTRARPAEPSVWTPRREEVLESRAVALALETLHAGLVLEHVGKGTGLLLCLSVALLAGLVLPRWRRSAALAGALLLAGVLLAILGLRLWALWIVPVGPTALSVPAGLLLGLALRARRERRDVEGITEELRRSLALAPLETPAPDEASLTAFRQLIDAEVVAHVDPHGPRVTLSAAAGGEELLGAIGGEAARLFASELTAGQSEVLDFPRLDTAGVSLGIGGGQQRLLLLPTLSGAGRGEVERWWRSQSTLGGLLASAWLQREPGGSSREAALYRLRYTALKAASERGFLAKVVELIPDSLLIADALGRPLIKNQAHDALAARLACAPRLIPFLAALLKGTEDVAARMVSEALSGTDVNLYATLELEDRTLNVALLRLDLGELGTSLLLMTRDVSQLTRLERVKGTAYAGMTEHVRGALQAVSMTAEMIGLDSDEAEVRESMDLIRSKVGEIDGALGDAAQATSLDLETAETHSVAIDLGEELARTLERVAPQARELGVELVREGQEITHHAVGRSTPTREALELALSEAIASSPAQGEVRAELLRGGPGPGAGQDRGDGAGACSRPAPAPTGWRTSCNKPAGRRAASRTASGASCTCACATPGWR